MKAPAEELAYGLDLTGVDPADLTRSLAEAAAAVARRPDRLAAATAGLALEEARVWLDAARRALGADGEPVVRPDRRDRRFGDRAWSENPFLLGVLESYLVSSRWAHRLLDAAELPEHRARKASFALGLVLDALAPTNFPWLNPAVVKEAIDTGGLSLARGLGNWLRDVAENGGRPRQVDTSTFEVGRTLAATPGRVVFRNELIELIAYEPQTDSVQMVPIVYSPAWINKYYVLDLAPGRSFVEHAVQQGFTVFSISYRSADASMAGLTLDDYLRDGVLRALDVALEATGSPRAHLLGVCTGGTMAAIALAVLAARGEADRVACATLVNALVDYSEPGDLAVFADESAIERVERRARRRGYLDESALANTFAMLRGSDLVWSYVVSGWYMGKQPPASDVFAWSVDSTRLPAAMHAQFLRACYLDNLLVQPGGLVIDGTPVDLSLVETPLYVLDSERDHIVPWRSSYATTQLVRGDTRHVLTGGGHITGIVNPPGGKTSYRVAETLPPGAAAWLDAAELIEGSWWPDWTAWAHSHSGERVAPPAVPEGEPAPGKYVRT